MDVDMLDVADLEKERGDDQTGQDGIMDRVTSAE